MYRGKYLRPTGSTVDASKSRLILEPQFTQRGKRRAKVTNTQSSFQENLKCHAVSISDSTSQSHVLGTKTPIDGNEATSVAATAGSASRKATTQRNHSTPYLSPQPERAQLWASSIGRGTVAGWQGDRNDTIHIR